MNFATELLHDKLLPDKLTGATTLPIFQTAAYNHASAEDLEKIFAGRKPSFTYSRAHNQQNKADLRRGRRQSQTRRGGYFCACRSCSENNLPLIVISGKNFHWHAEKFSKLAEYEQFGALSYLVRLRAKMLTNFGACPSPLNIFLTNEGLNTLAVRMERACLNALEFALKALNIGDAKTLVIHPASTIYLHASETERLNVGVTDNLIRVSVGIEDIADLLDDFGQALSAT